MSPKYYQVITIQGESKGFKPTVKGKHKTASKYLRENHGTLSLPSDPAPSSLPLQGGKGFSRSSSELSSSEDVWQPRKREKMRESGGKRKEAGTTERFPPILLMSKSCLWLQCIGAYILPQPSKITKRTKIKSYWTNLEENQKVTKRIQKGKRRRKSIV